MKDILVTVCCTAYNHEKYIRNCLDGFIMQKTSFNYEVIVHDDASTDGTQDIIREYAEKYPDIIKPIYQKENKYQNNISIIKEYILPQIRGKYVAFCEGDDFWCDPLKLQKQVQALESNPDSNLCVHSVQAINEDGSYLDKTYPNHLINSYRLSSKDFFCIACKDYEFQTTSYMIRADLYNSFLTEDSELFDVAPVGDWPMLLYFGSQGSVIFISDIMSCYRNNSYNSFCSTFNDVDLDKKISFYKQMIQMVKVFDEFTNYEYREYSKYLYLRELKGYYYLLSENKKYKDLISKQFRVLFKNETIKNKMFILFNAFFPKLSIYLNRL